MKRLGGIKPNTRRLLITIVFCGLLFFSFFNSNIFAGSRNCDGNALVYCGTLTQSELTSKLSTGTGKQYQSAKELQSLFSRVGFEMSDVKNLHDGRVTRDNKVYIGNTVVASNVYTFGRHNISGSQKINDVPYPLYKRHPSVSFLSDSISAFVYTNPDGSMAYAILKSCGNIVEGVGKKKPNIVQEVKVPLTIQKFEDANKNKKLDSGELALSGWGFKIKGPSLETTRTTDKNGQIKLTDLKQGIYLITEVGQTGWASTTGLTQSRLVNTTKSTQLFVFGNVKSSTPNIPGVPGGGEISTVTILPSTGLVENIAIFVTGALALALVYYYLSRHLFHRAAHGHHEPTNPKKLIKELRHRTKKRQKK